MTDKEGRQMAEIMQGGWGKGYVQMTLIKWWQRFSSWFLCEPYLVCIAKAAAPSEEIAAVAYVHS